MLLLQRIAPSLGVRDTLVRMKQSEVIARQARRRERMVQAMLDDWAPMLSAAERQDAMTLERAGRIFSVQTPAGTRWPAWQFHPDGRPRAIVGEVLAVLPREQMSSEGVALWWYAANAWTPEEARPCELIGAEEEPHILDAARRLSEPCPL